MSLVTLAAPDFTASAVMPDGGIIEDFKLSDYRGKYVVIFFYPLDFTFVCPTELRAFNRALPQFVELDTQVIAVSIDSVYSHFAWRDTPVTAGGVGKVGFPMVSDLSKHISRAYGVLTPDETVALRGLFLIDRGGIVRHEVVNDLSLGRSVTETLRMTQALQFYEAHGDVCPADWHEGEAAVHPTLEGIADYLGKH